MNQDTLHPGIAIVVMLDELVHHVQPDGSISHCLDISCPCWEQGPEPVDDYINLSAQSVASVDPDENLEARLARQEQQHIEDRAKRDMWGCYNDDDDLRFNAWHGSNRD